MGTLLPIVQEALEAADISYEVFDCDPELADTAAFCKAYGFREDQSANTIVVAGKTDPVKYAACVILATTKLDVNKRVCKLLEARKASFAPMDRTLEISGMEYGGVTIFGLPKELPIYIDSRIMSCERVVMGGGNRSSKVVLTPEELRKLPGVTVVEDLAKAKE